MTADILYYTMAVLLVLFSAGCWALNLFSIPGNWIMIALATLFAWLMPTGEGQGISWEIIGTIVIVGLLAELVEFAASAVAAPVRDDWADFVAMSAQPHVQPPAQLSLDASVHTAAPPVHAPPPPPPEPQAYGSNYGASVPTLPPPPKW